MKMKSMIDLLFGWSMADGRPANRPARRLGLGIGMALVIPLIGSLTGCLGYVDSGYGGYGVYGDGGGYYDEGPGPDLFLFGGDYDRGRDVQAYSHRGSASRAAAHAGGGGHSGGGHGGGHGGRR